MRLKLLLIAIVLAAAARANQRYSNFCEIGGRTVLTGGVPGSQKVQGSYPQCLVTVYLTGTLTLATIYSNNSSTALANPFTAQVNGSFFFYAANGRYDVTISGGGLPSPYTFGDVLLADPTGFTTPVLSFNGRTGNVTFASSDIPSRQGNSSTVQMAGTNSGTPGALLCDDGNGNTTTTGCAGGTNLTFQYSATWNPADWTAVIGTQDMARFVVNNYPITKEAGWNTIPIVQGLVGAVNVPSNSTVTNSFGLGGYAIVNSTTGAAVGVYGQGLLGAQSGAWGANFITYNAATQGGTGIQGNLWGVEVDVSTSAAGAAPANARGISVVSDMYQVPVVINSAFRSELAEGAVGVHPFNVAFDSSKGSAATALLAGQNATGNSQPSQLIELLSTSSGGATLVSNILQDSSGNLTLRANSGNNIYLGDNTGGAGLVVNVNNGTSAAYTPSAAVWGSAVPTDYVKANVNNFQFTDEYTGGGAVSAGTFSIVQPPTPIATAWDSTHTYASGNIVSYAGVPYASLANANLNHQPDVAPTWWGTKVKGAWSSVTTYTQYDEVTYGGGSFVALQSANTNHQPDTSTTWWMIKTTVVFSTAASFYSTGGGSGEGSLGMYINAGLNTLGQVSGYQNNVKNWTGFDLAHAYPGNLYGNQTAMNTIGVSVYNLVGDLLIDAMWTSALAGSSGHQMIKALPAMYPFTYGLASEDGASLVGIRLEATVGPTIATKTFATLPAATAGDNTAYRCTDCTQTTPAAGGGAGAIVQGVSGTWDGNPANAFSQPLQMHSINPLTGARPLLNIYEDGAGNGIFSTSGGAVTQVNGVNLTDVASDGFHVYSPYDLFVPHVAAGAGKALACLDTTGKLLTSGCTSAITTDIVPTSDATINLGSAAKAYATVYTTTIKSSTNLLIDAVGGGSIGLGDVTNGNGLLITPTIIEAAHAGYWLAAGVGTCPTTVTTNSGARATTGCLVIYDGSLVPHFLPAF